MLLEESERARNIRRHEAKWNKWRDVTANGRKLGRSSAFVKCLKKGGWIVESEEQEKEEQLMRVERCEKA